jgi:hypothetical protein
MPTSCKRSGLKIAATIAINAQSIALINYYCLIHLKLIQYMWVALALPSVWNFGCVGLWMKLHIVLEPRVSSWSHGFRNLSKKIVASHPHIGLFSHMYAYSSSIHHWLYFLPLHMREGVVKISWICSGDNVPMHTSWKKGTVTQVIFMLLHQRGKRKTQ